METILTTREQQLSATWSLVLSAMNIQHQVVIENDDYSLQVPSPMKLRALYELDLYFDENSNWPPKEDVIHETNSGIQPPTLLLMGVLALFYGVTGPWSEQSLWFTQGAGNSEAILQGGEWFRLITALTLHADVVHLMGNIFLGGFLIHFFCKLQGTGVGISSLLVSAIAGNWINVTLRGPGHYFVGFSTAVFAVIGMLAMVNYRGRQRASRLHFFMPFMAGAALLAMVGSSGERTDLGAHLFGLTSGLFVGRLLCFKQCDTLRNSFAVQTILFIGSGLLIYNAWNAALAQLY